VGGNNVGRIPQARPAGGTRLLYVMVDVETSHPIKAIGEVFELAVRPFRVETVGANDGKNVAEPLLSQMIKPSLEFGDSEFFYKTIEVSPAAFPARRKVDWARLLPRAHPLPSPAARRPAAHPTAAEHCWRCAQSARPHSHPLLPPAQTTGRRRADVNNKKTFPEVFGFALEKVEASRKRHKCHAVVCCGWNGYTIDHPWLRTMCLRHDVSWPDSWVWGWDPLRSIQYVHPLTAPALLPSAHPRPAAQQPARS